MKMKIINLFGCLLVALNVTAADSLEQNFQQPPPDARPAASASAVGAGVVVVTAVVAGAAAAAGDDDGDVTTPAQREHNASATKGFQWMRPFHPSVKQADWLKSALALFH